MPVTPLDVDGLLRQLSLEEKVQLLAGQGSFKTTGLPERGIPQIVTSDGPHGIRGVRSFERTPSVLFPSATAMGATFDVELLRQVGSLLGEEAHAKRVNVLLAPTVCLQRSPLMGRNFEAFGEDPILSGLLGEAYVKGVQSRGVGTSIKHYAAHDQSDNSIEDDVLMTERTLRELHLLPFQLSFRNEHPWTVMTSYNKINGLHCSEDPLLLKKILRDEWKFDGLVMSDWWGTYSTSEAINAGLDLEMPGPAIFRGKALSTAVNTRKVSRATLDEAVRNVLNLTNKVSAVGTKSPFNPSSANTQENRTFVRKVAAESIVLLKNNRNILPIVPKQGKTYGLIGDHFKYPALSGGGSAEVDPYYSITPYDAMVEAVGEENVTYLPGCYSFKFSPFLKNITRPDSKGRGWFVEIFAEDPDEIHDTKPIYTTITEKDLVDVPESFHSVFPEKFFVRAQTVFTPEKSARFRFGFGVSGKGKLKIDGKVAIDQWTSQLPKTESTACFNRLCMDKFHDRDVKQGQPLEIQIVMVNENVSGGVGTALTLCGRLGGYEVLDEDQAIRDAAELAKKVDVPILVTGLSSDYEYEAADRKDLRLPRRVDELIQAVLEANPNTIIVTQSGSPIEMPWESQANTLVHAWFGGQEVGNGLVDVLTGKVNPAGRLSLTFPKSVKHNPAYLTFGKADRGLMYGEGVFIGHRYYEKVDREALFYFGYGLSYSRFEYSDFAVPSEFKPTASHTMEISVTLKNLGPHDGSEVVQVYVQDPESSVQRPLRELKAFRKERLAVGESKIVKLTLDKYSLSFWSEEVGQWKAEAGEFVVILATSSNPKDEVARRSFQLSESFFWTGV